MYRSNWQIFKNIQLRNLLERGNCDKIQAPALELGEVVVSLVPSRMLEGSGAMAVKVTMEEFELYSRITP